MGVSAAQKNVRFTYWLHQAISNKTTKGRSGWCHAGTITSVYSQFHLHIVCCGRLVPAAYDVYAADVTRCISAAVVMSTTLL